jgi:putative DNA primase/helicase
VETTKTPDGTGPDQTSANGATSTNRTSPSIGGAPEHSQDALALKFSEKHHKNFRYTAAHGRWSEFNGRRWQSDDATPHVFSGARAICRADAKSCGDYDLARNIASASTVAAVERLARFDPRHLASVDQWDANPWLLNTPKGVIDLRTGAMRPARPEDYITKITAVGPASGCPLWHKFLDRITGGNRERQKFLQRLCGYFLTGLTGEEVFPFFYGTGANGKTKFVEAIAGMMGDYARSAPIETFVVSQSERHPTELAGLQGYRLVTATETEEGQRWAESKLKMLTGGDRISARFMRQDFFDFRPQFKLLISGNHRPALRSVDEAARRRFILVPFDVTIPPEERDKQLGDKLRAEWPGILGWAIEGCLEWQRGGLQIPQEVQAATDEYFAQEDALGRWIEERCASDVNTIAAVSALWADWKKWSDDNNEWTGKLKSFSQNLAARGFQPGRTEKGRYFRGLRLRFLFPGSDVPVGQS